MAPSENEFDTPGLNSLFKVSKGFYEGYIRFSSMPGVTSLLFVFHEERLAN